MGDGSEQVAPGRDLVPQTVRALYMQAPISNSTVLVIATLYFAILRDRLLPQWLSLWTAAMFCTAFLRLLLWASYQRREGIRSERFWLNSYTLASLLVGVSWGSIHLFTGSFDDLLVVVASHMLVFGVLSSAVSILSYHLPAFLGYCLPQAVLFGLSIHRQGDPELYPLIAALGLYLLMLFLFARNANRQFRQSTSLSLENAGLVERLHEENEQREEVIRQRTQTLAETNVLLEEQIRVREQAEEALRAQSQSLQDMAEHDALTGLPNRLLLADRLSQSIARAQRTPTKSAILFIDLDHFKQINDSLGHSAGDGLLQAVARRLSGVVRDGDTVARLGGDEFILLVEGLDDVRTARQLAAKIIDAFETPFHIDGNAFSIGASIGISLCPDDGDDLETLLRNADAAMYQAKADGRGGYSFYSAEMTEQARARLMIEADLRQALEASQFELFYQPVLSVRDGRVVGAEALLRWHHPGQGLLMPDTFIHVAEESNLINAIGLWVVEQGCRQIVAWQEAGLGGLVLATNLSAREFWNNPLVESVQRILDETGCSPAALEFEITESFLMHRPGHSRELISALRGLGISVAVDDFGTGYSSLAYLKQFPISKLKIDRSFVRDLGNDPDDQAIVRAIIALGHSLELAVVGEGVESEVQADFLRREGCDHMQGFLYARPMPAAAFFSYAMASRQREALAAPAPRR
jgi:diguanylate cyclase (GGDEF)-like protein